MKEHNIKIFKEQIKVINEIEFAQDNNGYKYRYKLYKEWGKGKKALAIMLNPSKANCVKSDNTITNVTNFFYDKGFKSLAVLNLFSLMSTDPKRLIHANQSYEDHNLDILNCECENADEILVGWGQFNSRTDISKEVKDILLIKKDIVLEMLKSHNKKTYCFRDEKGKQRHPMVISGKWSYEKYFKDIN